MVIESLLNPLNAENKPKTIISLGFLYVTVALFLSYWIFPDQSSLIFIFLTVMAAIPLMFGIINNEEKKDVSDFHEVTLLKEHSKALYAFMLLFIGMVLAITFWYLVLPNNIELILFDSQIDTLVGMNHNIVTGDVTSNQSIGAFVNIFLNNLKVLIFCIIFSLLYGFGAIFILTWNASVIGVAIGNVIRTNFVEVASYVGFNKITSYFGVVSFGLLKYSIHGIPEILAYFVAALAGGIISIAVIRHDFKGKKFEHVLLDSTDLILISIGLTLIAAILEVWVTPLIF
jgi:uncharacterized membrane protein SpoIIM required for sporulation